VVAERAAPGRLLPSYPSGPDAEGAVTDVECTREARTDNLTYETNKRAWRGFDDFAENRARCRFNYGGPIVHSCYISPFVPRGRRPNLAASSTVGASPAFSAL